MITEALLAEVAIHLMLVIAVMVCLATLFLLALIINKAN